MYNDFYNTPSIFGITAPTAPSPTSAQNGKEVRLYNLTAYIYNTQPERVMNLLDRYSVGASSNPDENVMRSVALCKQNKDALTELVKMHPDRPLFDADKHKAGCKCSKCKPQKKKFWEKSWITPSLLLILIILSIVNLIRR